MPQLARREPGVFRLLSWNVRDLLDDPLAVVRVLASAAPDLACLQEAPRGPRSAPRLADLARRAGLFYVAGGRASGGTAILGSARLRVLAAEAFALPVSGCLTRPRGAVLVQVALPSSGAVPASRPTHVGCLHLGVDPAERARHVHLLLERLAGRQPMVLAGDLNETPGGPSWQALGGLAADPAPAAQPTFPVRDPQRRIDAVLVDPSITVARYAGWRVDPADAWIASDHLPVLAELALPA